MEVKHLGIAGYTYGTEEVATSPVSISELDELKRAIGFDDDDVRYLRLVGEVLSDRVDDVFEHFMTQFGELFTSYFRGPDGEIDQGYLDAVHPRFVQWLDDTCNRPYDQAWLDYQHEIALRHHRAKKNRTDGVDSVPVVHYRYLVALIYPMSTIRHLLAGKGHSAEQVDLMHQAWTKALVLHVALWGRPYLSEADW